MPENKTRVAHRSAIRRGHVLTGLLLSFGLAACGASAGYGGYPASEAQAGYAPPAPPMAMGDEANRERYEAIDETGFARAEDAPLSTFAIDVDTAAYSNVRRFLGDEQLPPADAVRIEELLNYFDYDYPAPQNGEAFAVHTEVSEAPWDPSHQLVHIGIQGREIALQNVPPRNLVFLLDVSGSMSSPDKLPLLKHGMKLLAQQMRPQDKVAIVVYAGASGVVLEPTSDESAVITALDRLSAGGGTNGAGGIRLAYQLARKHFDQQGINRVILATDGDFNVGASSDGELVRMIEQERKSGVFLTVLGFGTGNLNDSMMEKLADKGNGNYAYIDSEAEARKVLSTEAGSTLVTIAKDVKIQVELNPKLVESYRLIGYENRRLDNQDFNDDTKDGGELGAGHTVTALYEVVPKGGQGPSPAAVDPLKYQTKPQLSAAANAGELMTVKLRFKQPDGDKSSLVTHVVPATSLPLADTSKAFRFSAGVAAFGLVLSQSKHRGTASLDLAKRLSGQALGADPHGHRRGFMTLVEQASRLTANTTQVVAGP